MNRDTIVESSTGEESAFDIPRAAGVSARSALERNPP